MNFGIGSIIFTIVFFSFFTIFMTLIIFIIIIKVFKNKFENSKEKRKIIIIGIFFIPFIWLTSFALFNNIKYHYFFKNLKAEDIKYIIINNKEVDKNKIIPLLNNYNFASIDHGNYLQYDYKKGKNINFFLKNGDIKSITMLYNKFEKKILLKHTNYSLLYGRIFLFIPKLYQKLEDLNINFKNLYIETIKDMNVKKISFYESKNCKLLKKREAEYILARKNYYDFFDKVFNNFSIPKSSIKKHILSFVLEFIIKNNKKINICLVYDGSSHIKMYEIDRPGSPSYISKMRKEYLFYIKKYNLNRKNNDN